MQLLPTQLGGLACGEVGCTLLVKDGLKHSLHSIRRPANSTTRLGLHSNTSYVRAQPTMIYTLRTAKQSAIQLHEYCGTKHLHATIICTPEVALPKHKQFHNVASQTLLFSMATIHTGIVCMRDFSAYELLNIPGSALMCRQAHTNCLRLGSVTDANSSKNPGI